MSASPANTPAPALPAEVWAEMQRIGPIWGSNVPGHVQRMVDVFTALHKQRPADDVVIARDLAYGPHQNHRLDVFSQPGAQSRPVIVFVHGGAFVSGRRDRSDEIYANVLRYFARHGYVGVNIDYRLAPEATYPSGAQDVGAAIAWVRSHIADYGGAPDTIFLAAHSAGGAHACAWLCDPHVRRQQAHGVSGLLIISGRVRADADGDNPNAVKVRAYYGDDLSTYAERSPVSHASRIDCPVFVAFAEYENPLIDIYCLELAHQVARGQRRAPDVVRLLGHNHTSIIAHINTAEDDLGRRMRLFLQRVLNKNSSQTNQAEKQP
ncbi:MAG: alpha/beta hydrolase [Steroidobacteraceae bacterium]